jgi:hypothetical protein
VVAVAPQDVGVLGGDGGGGVTEGGGGSIAHGGSPYYTGVGGGHEGGEDQKLKNKKASCIDVLLLRLGVCLCVIASSWCVSMCYCCVFMCVFGFAAGLNLRRQTLLDILNDD